MATCANAREFVEAVLRRYRALSAYSDTGRSHRPHCRHTCICQFETDFRAPGDFRFAFTRPHPFRGLSHRWISHVVGRSESAPYLFTRSYAGQESMSTPSSLEMAVAGATGISGGTAHTIAALLFEEVGGFGLLDLRRLRFRRSRVVDGVPCTAVSGLHPRGGRYTAWFGAEDLLLRRLVDARARAEEVRTNLRVDHGPPDGRFSVPSAGMAVKRVDDSADPATLP